MNHAWESAKFRPGTYNTDRTETPFRARVLREPPRWPISAESLTKRSLEGYGRGGWARVAAGDGCNWRYSEVVVSPVVCDFNRKTRPERGNAANRESGWQKAGVVLFGRKGRLMRGRELEGQRDERGVVEGIAEGRGE